jgi:hypothetical protein
MAAAAAAGAQHGCAVRVADNSTLVPTLLQDADVSTQQPLLVIVPFNVSLGRGLGPGAIRINRCEYVRRCGPAWATCVIHHGFGYVL